MRQETALKLANTERARFLVEGLDLPTATDIPDAEWELFQLNHLNDDSSFRHDVKSRQVGWSWLVAAEGIAVTHLAPRSTYLFVSINREESAEKIRYARQIYDALYPGFRQSITSDNINSIAFGNGSRLLSLPQRPVRGKAKAWLCLDEYAHYRLDKDIYRAALPVTSKGGKIRIGSSPLGARGMFWEIGEQKTNAYPGYSRAKTPWWAVSALVKEEWRRKLREVAQDAPLLATAERVIKYANQRILDIFLNMPLEDFQQEYECTYVDETVAYIAWADIFAACMPETSKYLRWVTHTPDEAFNAIDEIAEAVASNQIVGPLTWGLDVGRKKDLTELIIGEVQEGGTRVMRAMISLDRQPFDLQERLCKRMLDSIPTLRRGFLDQNGLGMQMAESLNVRDGYGERAMPMSFTNQNKSTMAQHLKTRFQKRGNGQFRIIDDRDLKYQIHSVRRRVTPSGNTVFDVESSERHHADKFWALAMCNEAAETLERVDALPSAPTLVARETRAIETVSALEHEEIGYRPEYVPDFGLTPDEFDALISDGIVWPSWYPERLLPRGARIVDATPFEPFEGENDSQQERSSGGDVLLASDEYAREVYDDDSEGEEDERSDNDA